MKLLTAITLFSLLWPAVLSQGLLSELAAVMGILPTSQLLLAGGGLIGLKLAILIRFMALVGLIRDHFKAPALLPHGSGTGRTNTSLVEDLAEETTLPPGCQDNTIAPDTTSYFGLPSVLRHFGFGDQDLEGNSTSVHPLIPVSICPNAVISQNATVGPKNSSVVTDEDEMDSFLPEGVFFDNETAYFPIPGLKIGVDNRTGKSFLLFDHNVVVPASVFVPPADKSTGSTATPTPLDLSTERTLNNTKDGTVGEERVTGHVRHEAVNRTSEPSRVNFLLYPHIVRGVDTTAAQHVNESKLMVRLASGSVVRMEEARETTPTVLHRNRRSANQAIGGHVRNKSSAGDQIEPNIATYFAMIQSLDVSQCFSRLACEIGANGTFYGKYGFTVGSFFSSLDPKDYEPDTRAHYYISRYYYGKNHTFESCSEGSPCKQDLLPLIEPLNLS